MVSRVLVTASANWPLLNSVIRCLVVIHRRCVLHSLLRFLASFPPPSVVPYRLHPRLFLIATGNQEIMAIYSSVYRNDHLTTGAMYFLVSEGVVQHGEEINVRVFWIIGSDRVELGDIWLACILLFCLIVTLFYLASKCSICPIILKWNQFRFPTEKPS